MIKIWTIHFEMHKGYRPKLHIFRAPRHGDRVVDGGVPGTLIACKECSGVGLLHLADSDQPLPRPVPEESPDTLVVDLLPTSLDYQIGEVVWTHKADYRVETIVYDGPSKRSMYLLRLDLTKRPIVKIEGRASYSTDHESRRAMDFNDGEGGVIHVEAPKID